MSGSRPASHAMMLPPPATNDIALIWVEMLPRLRPVPWVAVDTAPAIDW